jgi:hypothetical protein
MNMARASSRSKQPEAVLLQRLVDALEKIAAHLQMQEYRESARLGASKAGKDRRKMKARSRGGIV